MRYYGMDDDHKTKKQLIAELVLLRRQNTALSAAQKTASPSGPGSSRPRKRKNSLKEVLEITEQETVTTAEIIAAIGDGVSIQDRDFRVLYQNRAHKDMAGGDKKGSRCYSAYAHNTTICKGCPVKASFRDGKTHQLEKPLPDNKGYIEIKSSPLYDRSGAVVAGIEVVRDISGRKLLEKKLAESELRYRTLFERAGDAIFILEAEGKNRGRIIDANRAAAEMHGYSIQELLTMKITDLDTPETASKAPGRFRRILQGEQLKTEATHHKKNGDVIYVEITAGLIEFSSNKYILALDRNITRRKLIEQERETLIRDLQDAVENIKTLRGLIPICAWCKKIRDDNGYWEKVEDYIQQHSLASFSHGICPECLEKESPEVFKEITDKPELYDRVYKKKNTE